MTSDHHTCSKSQILVVACNCDLPDDAERETQAYTLCRNVKKSILMMTQTRYLCVLAYVDPFNNDSIEQLKILRDRAVQDDVALATLSLFNPVWIENLLAQFGVNTHFKSFPSFAVLMNFAETNRLETSPRLVDSAK